MHRVPSMWGAGRVAVMRTAVVTASLTVVIVGLTSCSGPTSSAPGPGGIAVAAGEDKCVLSTPSVPAGRSTFAVTNTGSRVTEVYVYAQGDRVLGEVENIGPGTRREFVVDLVAGDYEMACKPGMVGTGIRTPLHVTGQPAAPQPKSAQMADGVDSYRSYVRAEAQALVDSTAPFVAAVVAGDAAKARELYPSARTHYERIEPIAESFGDLDPLIDMRIDDVQAGAPFTGFHRLEHDLYGADGIKGSGATATKLLNDTRTLASRISSVEITPLSMANGAKSLLDEVAKSKVTGEEERYSHIDLVDFAGNVDGARTAYAALRPVVAAADADLAATVDARFVALQSLLDTHRAKAGDPGAPPGSEYVSYTSLNPEQVKALAASVDALSEPLGRLPSTMPSQ